MFGLFNGRSQEISRLSFLAFLFIRDRRDLRDRFCDVLPWNSLDPPPGMSRRRHATIRTRVRARDACTDNVKEKRKYTQPKPSLHPSYGALYPAERDRQSDRERSAREKESTQRRSACLALPREDKEREKESRAETGRGPPALLLLIIIFIRAACVCVYGH